VRPPGAAALASVDLYWLLFVRRRPQGGGQRHPEAGSSDRSGVIRPGGLWWSSITRISPNLH